MIWRDILVSRIINLWKFSCDFMVVIIKGVKDDDSLKFENYPKNIKFSKKKEPAKF